jgi:hypothetical protein
MRKFFISVAVLLALAAITARTQTNISQPSAVNVTQVGGSAVSQAGGVQTVALSATAANPCQNPNATLTAIAGATSGTSATQIIALASGKQIFICSVVLTTISGTSPTYKLEYGTGSNCAVVVGTLVGPSAVSVAGNVFSYANAFIVPASDELCYLDGGTTPIYDYAIVYVQQ